MKNTEHCSVCDAAYPPEQLVEFDGQLLCPECLASETVICSHCGDRIWRRRNVGTNIPLCERCYTAFYTTCSRCGRVLNQSDVYYGDNDDDDDEAVYCYDCSVHRHAEQPINDYYYKPDPIFYGDGQRFFGVELEIDNAGESESNARTLLQIANCNGLHHLYCKHDGSLDDGFELVSHPMTLDYHKSEMPWRRILEEAREMGYLSHQANTCGLHVHVNRTAFGATEAEQDSRIARVLYFFEKHWEELLKFSRRTQRQLEHWAARYGYKEQPREILDHAKKGCHGGRYTCVNLTNGDTIEFRMFRGTLKLNTLIATLQLVNRICDVALYLSDEELKAMSWTTFVSGCTEPELVTYLKERRLYVNEPVVAEMEV